MTDKPTPDNERQDLAAEYALGVLTGAERARARRLAAEDPDFRADAERWTGRLSPMLDEVEPVSPPEGAWRQIEQSIDGGAPDRSNVIELKRRVRIWQGVAGVATALAASLAVVLAIPRPAIVAPPSPTIAASAPMVAMLNDDQKEMMLVASWDPAGRRLVLAAAGDMPGDDAHAHELWVIPAGGKPRSLGTMRQPKTHVELAGALAELMRQGATIAISVEPRGGSPTGQPTGPVIASGTLEGA